MKRGKKGQVWVETVIYTLIALTMMGLVLAFVKPKIEEFQDKTIIMQSTDMLKKIDNIIKEIRAGGSGNQRKVEINIKKGNLEIDGVNDELIFLIEESRCEYSELEEEYREGEIIITTEKKGETNLVTLKRDYSENYNITYQNKDETKSLTKASSTYNLFILNKGEYNGKTVIDMEIK
jgi:hypothetical protein